jgi:hypothetical protein
MNIGVSSFLFVHSSFLPQDKVSGFAQMSPQQLLKETQRAAGEENLSAWHQILIDHGNELRGIQCVCLQLIDIIARLPFSCF